MPLAVVHSLWCSLFGMEGSDLRLKCRVMLVCLTDLDAPNQPSFHTDTGFHHHRLFSPKPVTFDEPMQIICRGKGLGFHKSRHVVGGKNLPGNTLPIAPFVVFVDQHKGKLICLAGSYKGKSPFPLGKKTE